MSEDTYGDKVDVEDGDNDDDDDEDEKNDMMNMKKKKKVFVTELRRNSSRLTIWGPLFAQLLTEWLI